MQEESFFKFLILQVINIYEILIVIRAIISWFSPHPGNPLYQLLIKLTEPLLAQLRRFLPRSNIDFSPIIALLLLSLLGRVIQGL